MKFHRVQDAEGSVQLAFTKIIDTTHMLHKDFLAEIVLDEEEIPWLVGAGSVVVALEEGGLLDLRQGIQSFHERDLEYWGREGRFDSACDVAKAVDPSRMRADLLRRKRASNSFFCLARLPCLFSEPDMSTEGGPFSGLVIGRSGCVNR